MNGLAREDTDMFVRLLTRYTPLDQLHNDIFRGYERDLLLQLRPYHSGENDKAVGDVVEEDEKGVGQEEHFWDVDSTDGAVVESALEPLAGECVGEVCGYVA